MKLIPLQESSQSYNTPLLVRQRYMCFFVVVRVLARKLTTAHVSVLPNLKYAMTSSPFSK